MRIRAFKYLSPFIIYAGSLNAFSAHGWVVWLPLLYAWVIIPVLELFMKPDPKNMDAAEEEIARKDRVYDLIIYLVVPLQFLALIMFLQSMTYGDWA